ncbi:FAD-dependent monooxygenase [Mucilaginibacter lappiensis]|uniref:2-polyprenyl-6-methoxyphenol hydroxylase-like FAD-dependent oxidoreductase n=1 Tax=Mucilaginibacter lappiensis TaxID=354630 RepID=A0A841JHH9_9SPHI|nr:FAD-dependent monooxygenase [Mucilaginibacter lappiensis]MBB6130619.1 2-polyprenyl-6-methoxyphenol hydroxylase-like FAD-dependent oxidoreductase [Mucilaginibacter lappiensis]
MESGTHTNVLISGASIAGLSTAYWLNKYGFNVTIVERASHIRPGGQAVDVRGPAIQVAERMGILDDIRKSSANIKGMSIVEAVSGKEIYRNNEQTLTSGRNDSPDVEILRDDLCKVLFEAVGDRVNYIFDDTVVTLDQDEAGVDVTFAHAAPQRFDLVIGADGIRSNIRKTVFGPDEQFVRYLGHYVAIFTMPNYFELDHWEMIFQHKGEPLAMCIAKDNESEARTYLGFSSDEPLEYDYRDINAQKQLIAEKSADVGGMISKLKELMQTSSNFYFDSVNQTIMDTWYKGRVVLVGDAGYSVSLSLGQSTSVAMVGAYVLTGELVAHREDLQAAFANYETELRDYIISNQNLAFNMSTEPQQTLGKPSEEGAIIESPDLPDFGLSVVPLTLKNY